MKGYSEQIYLFFYSVLFQVHKILCNLMVLSETKLKRIGCLKPFTTEPSTTSHFKCTLFVLLKFTIF